MLREGLGDGFIGESTSSSEATPITLPTHHCQHRISPRSPWAWSAPHVSLLPLSPLALSPLALLCHLRPPRHRQHVPITSPSRPQGTPLHNVRENTCTASLHRAILLGRPHPFAASLIPSACELNLACEITDLITLSYHFGAFRRPFRRAEMRRNGEMAKGSTGMTRGPRG